MNFTREPILETIIAAKEGYKLRLKSTKHEGAAEYVVDAVEVVSFGTTFFYRSLEPAHTFFVPAQDFEIVQVRRARLLLKTPSEKAIKIAGGAEGSKKAEKEEKKPKKKQSKAKASKEEKQEGPAEEEPKEVVAAEKVEGKEEKKDSKKEAKKDKAEKKPRSKGVKKATKEKKKAEAEPVDKEVVQPSMFSHLLRPPEALISDNIHQYQDMIESQKEEKVEKAEKKEDEAFVNVTSDPVPAEKVEAAALAEAAATTAAKEEKPLSLKEKMKKVLAPALKEPTKREEEPK